MFSVFIVVYEFFHQSYHPKQIRFYNRAIKGAEKGTVLAGMEAGLTSKSSDKVKGTSGARPTRGFYLVFSSVIQTNLYFHYDFHPTTSPNNQDEDN